MKEIDKLNLEYYKSCADELHKMKTALFKLLRAFPKTWIIEYLIGAKILHKDFKIDLESGDSPFTKSYLNKQNLK